MKRISLFVLTALLILGCSSEEKSSGEGNDETDTTQNGTGDTTSDNTCQNLKVEYPSKWSNGYIFVNDNGNKYLIINNEEALIQENAVLWVWSDTREGSTSSFTYSCDCKKCSFILDGTASDGEFVDANEQSRLEKVLKPLSNEAIAGNYYTSSNYKRLEISQSKIIVNKDEFSYVAFDRLSDSNPYLVYKTSGYSDDRQNYSVLYLKSEGISECPVCHHDHAEKFRYSLSDASYAYRTEAISKASFSNYEELYRIDFSECTHSGSVDSSELQRIWSSAKGLWNLTSYDNISTPYDTRSLKFIEMTRSEDGYNIVATYGVPSHYVAGSPERFNNIYTYNLEFHKHDECWDVNHNLSTSGSWQNEEIVKLDDSDELCPPNECSTSTDCNDQFCDGGVCVPFVVCDEKETLDTETNTCVEQTNVYPDIKGVSSSGYVEVASDTITFVFNNSLFLKGTILSYKRTDLENMYFDDLVVKITESEHSKYASCVNDSVPFRLYYYPNGSTFDPKPYFNFMYSGKTECSDTTMNKNVSGFYY